MIPQNVIVFIRDESSEKLLLAYRRDEPFVHRLNGVSGKMKEGETPTVAASRKLAEEFGLVINPDTLTTRGVVHTGAGNLWVVIGVFNIYAATNQQRHQRTFLDLNTNWGRENVAPNLKWLVNLAFDPDVMDGFEVTQR